jgi:hypothetical protein
MPRKTFVAGDVLTASDMNTFLMDQSVMTFADSAARGSAIPSPTEGMVTYLDDTDALEVFNGTSFTGIGGGAATNAIINGAFEIWQRGTSFTSNTNAFTADRFITSPGVDGTATSTRETFTPGAAPLAGVEAEYYLKINQTTEGTDTFNLQQFIEDVRTFAGQTVTVSFYARVSTGTHVITPELVQRFGSGGSSPIVTDNGTVTADTNWQRFSITMAVPSISGKTIGAGSSLQFRLGVGTATVKAYEYWGIQVEAGSVATPFRRNANSLQGELAACQRYYEEVAFRCRGNDGSTDVITISFNTRKRVIPTSTIVVATGTTPGIGNEFLSGVGVTLVGSPYDTTSVLKSSAEL